jgi:cell division septum initiation protein DivIVA
MPFGIPLPEEADYQRLIQGVEGNTTDLQAFGTKANARLHAGQLANRKDLSRPLGKVTQQFIAGGKANTTDLGQVAQSLALQLAAGAQANAGDLAGIGTAPPNIKRPPRRPTKAKLPGGAPGVPAGITPPGAGAPPGSAIIPGGGPANPTRPTEYVPLPPGHTRTGGQHGDSGAGNGNDVYPKFFTWIEIDQPENGLCVPEIDLCYDAVDCQTKIDYHRSLGFRVNPGGLIGGPFDLVAEADQAGADWRAERCQPGNGGGNGGNGNGNGGGNGHICPPPTECPPPVECPPPDGGDIIMPPEPVIGCPTFDWLSNLPSLANLIPHPGSERFCTWLTAFDSDAQPVLDLINAWIDGNITTEPLKLLFAGYDEHRGDLGSLLLPVADFIVNTIEYVVGFAASWVDAIICAFKRIRDWLMSLRFDCLSPSVFLLMAAKWLLNALKDWELGTDFVAWVVDRIHLEFGPFEQFLDMLIHWALPMEIPSAPEATRSWLMGQITDEHRDCIWRLNGLCPQVYATFAKSESEHLTADEIIRWGHRLQLDDKAIDYWMENRGWKIPEDRTARMGLFWEIPTINDHLQWLRRNVDDHDYVQRFGLLDGFAPDEFIRSLQVFGDYRTLTDTHGRDFWRAFGPDLTAQGMRPVYAAYHYAAHWVQPAPEQMKEFIYRLRPAFEGDPNGFTVADFKRILAEQDYAPLAVNWFAETAFRVPALTYIIGMYRNFVISDDDLKDYHQDLGYTLQDSERFVAVDSLIRNKMRTTEYKGWNPTALGSAFVTGALTRDEVFEKLTHIGGTRQEADDLIRVAQVQVDRQVWQRARSRLLTRTAMQVSRALEVGSINDEAAVNVLRQLGYPERQAMGVVEAERAVGRSKMIAQTVQAVKRSYHGGFVLRGQADSLLEEIGIIPTKRDEYLTVWDIQNTGARKRRTASEIINDLANGMMDTQEALFRLTNLGYDNADQLLYLADAQRKIVQNEAKAMAARARSQQQHARELERLRREAERQARQLRNELNRIAPRSVLTKWLKKRIINVGEFRVRMERLGYPDEVISKYAYDAPTEPTVKELQTWLKDKVIDDREFERQLADLGFDNRDIAFFLADAHHSAPPPPPPPPPGQGGSPPGRGGAGPPTGGP